MATKMRISSDTQLIIWLIAVFSCVHISSCASGCRCGESTIDPRVYGGHSVKPLRYPWVVSVVTQDGKFACAGTFLTDQWIVTAAHCLQNRTSSDLRINYGNINWKDSNRTSNVSKLVTHYKYDGSIGHHNDIGLIRLSVAVNFDGQIMPICLAKSSKSGKSRYYTTVGWGRTDDEFPDELQEVDVMHRSEISCSEWWNGDEKFDPTIQMCAGITQGSCVGDSGSPLMLRKRGQYILAGITAYGYDPCGMPDHPAVYTRVTPFVTWIRSMMLNEKNKLCGEKMADSGGEAKREEEIDQEN
ncbi:chymotrypsinogen A-like [Brevipalpus obovatus]|uniref:chymotrypsinogen A-like n=1 Tax=Brevipalpus obovatus TaxID=246614 RepID=UPI003D9F5659